MDGVAGPAELNANEFAELQTAMLVEEPWEGSPQKVIVL